MLMRLIQRVREIYLDYPRQFWILVGSMFIDLLGNRLLTPFLTLYVTQRFDVGMAQVGLLFGSNAALGMIGNMIGGGLTDRLGRKRMILFGLIVSGLGNLAIGLAGSFAVVVGALLFASIVGSVSGPAYGAMVGDMLPEEKQASGFGIFRVMSNLTWIIGASLGGLVASYSYLLLFLCDVVASTLAAAVMLVAVRETLPEPEAGEGRESVGETFAGYLHVLRDTTFVLFIGACILMTLVDQQQYTMLGVYLRDTHAVAEQDYGLLVSLNATMVVLFQFAITRRLARYQPLRVMTVGMLLYALGFSLFGFGASYPMFALAMVITVTGEMFLMPTSQALVTRLSPEDMRGRYMAVFGFSWLIPWMVGPATAGYVMDNLDPRWVWYGAGLVGLVTAASFALLGLRTERLESHLTQGEQRGGA
jgi:MFS family permease